MNLSGFRPNEVFYEYDTQKIKEYRCKFVTDHREQIDSFENTKQQEDVLKDIEYASSEQEIEEVMWF